MNNDAEKWRAYAEYLGGANAAGASPSKATSATAASSSTSEISPPNALSAFAGQQYFYPAPPAAPTPPSANPLDQYQYSYPFQYPYGQMPPPIPPGYVNNSSTHPEAGKPAIGTFSAGWHYTDPMAPTQPGPATTAASRAPSGEVVKRSTAREQWYQYECQYPDPNPPRTFSASPMPSPQPEGIPALPVLLCHTCIECGRMRSPGYHRTHPVVPGQPMVSDACRRCRKKARKSDEQCVRKFTHVRECRSNEPCNWPQVTDDIHIRVGRGRHRSRSVHSDELYVSRRRSYSRPRVVKKSESRTRFGLRVLQDDSNLPGIVRRKSTVRVSSRSPIRDYERVHVHMDRRHRRGSSPGPLPPPLPYPPMKHLGMRHPSPVPLPPSREQFRSRSTSPGHYRYAEGYREVDAEHRIASHPAAFRSVHPDRRSILRDTDEDLTPSHSPVRSAMPPRQISHSILRPVGAFQETDHRRRMSVHDSQQSTYVEVGGPRVQFASSSMRDAPRSLPDSETSEHVKFHSQQHRRRDGQYSGDIGFDYHHRQGGFRRQYSDEPLAQEFEEMRIRTRAPDNPPPPPARGRSPIRYVAPRSPSPPRATQKRAISYHERSISPPAPRDRIAAGYRNIPRPALRDREEEPPMLLAPREKDWEELTASDVSDEIVTIKKWRGMDENGVPATFVEERRTRPHSERERDREPPRGAGLGRDGRSLMAAAGSYRDV